MYNFCRSEITRVLEANSYAEIVEYLSSTEVETVELDSIIPPESHNKLSLVRCLYCLLGKYYSYKFYNSHINNKNFITQRTDPYIPTSLGSLKPNMTIKHFFNDPFSRYHPISPPHVSEGVCILVLKKS